MLGLHRRARVSGSIALAGEELVGLGDRRFGLRGRRMAMVFQDPLSALHPAYTVGEQIAEAHRHHFGSGRRAARRRAVEMLGEVGIPEPARRAGEYPHQFSGGMRQRAMIAMALSCEPELLVADEPTTALDVTVQAQILDLIVRLQEERGLGVLMITHDLGVVARVAHDVLVMYGGRGAEQAPVDALFEEPIPTPGGCWTRCPGWTIPTTPRCGPSPAVRRPRPSRAAAAPSSRAVPRRPPPPPRSGPAAPPRRPAPRACPAGGRSPAICP